MGTNLRKSSFWLISWLVCKSKRCIFKARLAPRLNFWFISLKVLENATWGNAANIPQQLGKNVLTLARNSPKGEGEAQSLQSRLLKRERHQLMPSVSFTSSADSDLDWSMGSIWLLGIAFLILRHKSLPRLSMQRFVRLIGAGCICNSTRWGRVAISGLANGLLYKKKYLIWLENARPTTFL